LSREGKEYRVAQGHLGGSPGLVPGRKKIPRSSRPHGRCLGSCPGRFLLQWQIRMNISIPIVCLSFTMAMKLAGAFAAPGFPESLQEALMVAELCVKCAVECLEDLGGCSGSPLQDCDVAMDIEFLLFRDDMVELASRAGWTSSFPFLDDMVEVASRASRLKRKRLSADVASVSLRLVHVAATTALRTLETCVPSRPGGVCMNGPCESVSSRTLCCQKGYAQAGRSRHAPTRSWAAATSQ
jgi:hypothetical protein